LTLGRQGNRLFLRFCAQEGVGDLNQDTGTIARQGVGPGGTAMGEILENIQTLLDDLMAFVPLDMGYEADAAGVMFIGRVIQPLPCGNSVRVQTDTSCENGWTAGI
jgi:hypothetical protein